MERSQPVLVGTTSIEKSEELSALLKKRKIPHNVLNAAITSKSLYRFPGGRGWRGDHRHDMAGRGTDIQLGGNAEMRIKQELTEVVTRRSAQCAPTPSAPSGRQ